MSLSRKSVPCICVFMHIKKKWLGFFTFIEQLFQLCVFVVVC